MKTKCPDIHTVPELAHLVPAIDRAKKVPCDENDLVLGLCNARGKVVGAATLRCYRQLSTLTRELGRLGYEPLVLPDERRMDGCDVVFIMRLAGDGEAAVTRGAASRRQRLS